MLIYIFLVDWMGFCFSCRMMERIREMSLLDLFVFGLKSHSLAIRSHSVPGSISSVSATNCFSAFLLAALVLEMASS
uniref:Putative secreted protein n=1 Tax=Anopheles marajoara TaxID=58244 RepID=A0A2M4CDP8_9DIPT